MMSEIIIFAPKAAILTIFVFSTIWIYSPIILKIDQIVLWAAGSGHEARLRPLIIGFHYKYHL